MDSRRGHAWVQEGPSMGAGGTRVGSRGNMGGLKGVMHGLKGGTGVGSRG